MSLLNPLKHCVFHLFLNIYGYRITQFCHQEQLGKDINWNWWQDDKKLCCSLQEVHYLVQRELEYKYTNKLLRSCIFNTIIKDSKHWQWNENEMFWFPVLSVGVNKIKLFCAGIKLSSHIQRSFSSCTLMAIFHYHVFMLLSIISFMKCRQQKVD